MSTTKLTKAIGVGHQSPPTGGTGPAPGMAAIPPTNHPDALPGEVIETVPLAVLEDRYEGLLYTPKGGDPTKLQMRLWRALEDLTTRTARRELDGSTLDLNGAEMITSELCEMIRGHIVRRLHETGAAR